MKKLVVLKIFICFAIHAFAQLNNMHTAELEPETYKPNHSYLNNLEFTDSNFNSLPDSVTSTFNYITTNTFKKSKIHIDENTSQYIDTTFYYTNYPESAVPINKTISVYDLNGQIISKEEFEIYETFTYESNFELTNSLVLSNVTTYEYSNGLLSKENHTTIEAYNGNKYNYTLTYLYNNNNLEYINYNDSVQEYNQYEYKYDNNLVTYKINNEWKWVNKYTYDTVENKSIITETFYQFADDYTIPVFELWFYKQSKLITPDSDTETIQLEFSSFVNEPAWTLYIDTKNNNNNQPIEILHTLVKQDQTCKNKFTYLYDKNNRIKTYTEKFWIESGQYWSVKEDTHYYYTDGNIKNSTNKNEILELYPIPAQDYIYTDKINLDFNQYKIYSINGSLHMHGALMNNSIYIGSLQQGIYLLELINTNSSTTSKFVKN